MRKDHYVLWKDENVDNSENSGYMKQLSKSLEVNIYCRNNNNDALQVLRTKNKTMVKLISNGSKGKDFIQSARNLIGSNFVSLVFTSSTGHMEWVSKMENVLLTVSPDDFKNFAALKMNKSDILSFIQGLKKKYETSKYKFLINENQLLKFPGIN